MDQPTRDDSYAAEVAGNYGQFVHVRPFYEYSFARARTWLTVDYGLEAIYCQLIELGTHATYEHEDTTTSAWITVPSSTAVSALSGIGVVKELGGGNYLVKIPRYQEFTTRALESAHVGIPFVQIAGNGNILISVLSDHSFNVPTGAEIVRSDRIPSEPERSRVALLCRVSELSETLLALEKQGVYIEHVYDF